MAKPLILGAKPLAEIAENDRDLSWKSFIATPGKRIRLKRDFPAGFTGGMDDRQAATQMLAHNVAALAELQDELYAHNRYGVLVVFQARDAAGKDSLIKNVFSGVNPQGCQVTSFKVPSSDELDHDFLWRAHKMVPGRGMIGVFNRSYYEEVLVVKVHPELLGPQRLPNEVTKGDVWGRRYAQINDFERYLTENGVLVLKFYLNVSKREQAERFLKRIDRPEKNWKFAVGDLDERRYWDQYEAAYEECIQATSTEHAPWFIVPADKKWYTRLVVSHILVRACENLKPEYPMLGKKDEKHLAEMRRQLMLELKR